jgi:DNA-directed RNA polymerase specialized sigma24 family protein
VGYLDREDVLAELKEQAVIAATDYNPARGKFTTLVWLRLLGHAVDLRRRHGRMARNGEPRPVEVAFPEEHRSPGGADGAGDEWERETPEGQGQGIDPWHAIEVAADLDATLAALPASERAVLLMRDYAGETPENIAAMFGTEPEEARLLRRHAVRRMRIGLAPRQQFPRP